MFVLVFIVAVLAIGWRYPGFLVSATFFGFTAGAIGAWPQSTSVLILLSIGMLVLKSLTRPVLVSASAIDVCFFIFIGWCCLSAAWQPNGPDALPTAGAFAGSTVLVYTLCRQVGGIGELRDRILEVAVGFCVLGVVVTPLAFAAGSFVNGRLFIGSSPPVGLSQPVPYVALSALALLVSIKSHRLAVLTLVVLSLGAAVALAAGTGARGALIAAGAGALIYILASGDLRSRFFVLLALVTLGLMALLLADQVAELQRGLVDRLFDFGSYGSTQDLSSLARYERYRFAWYLFEKSPLIGVGLGGYSALSGYEYPHNIFLEVGSTTGLIGLVAMLATVVAALVKVSELIRAPDRPRVALLLALFAAGFVHQQVSFELAQAKGLFMVGMIAGLVPQRQRLVQSPKRHFSGASSH